MNIDSHTVHSNSDEDKSSHSTHSAMNLEKEGLFARHVGALLRKRAANFKRDKKAWLCTTILPSLFVLLGFIIAVYAGVEKNLDPILLTLDDYNINVDTVRRNPIVYNSPGAYSCQPEMCAYPTPIMNSTTNPGTDELYHFCGEQARLNKTEQCTISQSTDIIEGINDAGAFSVETDVASLEEVRILRVIIVVTRSIANSFDDDVFFGSHHVVYTLRGILSLLRSTVQFFSHTTPKVQQQVLNSTTMPCITHVLTTWIIIRLSSSVSVSVESAT